MRSHLPPPQEFDSQVEAAFAAKWGDAPREGWTLLRETEVLHQGQKVFVPDFVLRHQDGRVVLLEIVGFWTPKYLDAKLQTLRAFSHAHILLAVAKTVDQRISELAPQAIVYKTALKVKEVLKRLEQISAPNSAQP